jgi:6-pyruvoyltetrahydropterin/6-carboxytetrahydropterin synthase
MDKRTTRIELFKEDFKFSSGHFTIFSDGSRENLHGHNFTVHVAFDAVVEGNGIIFDYMHAKDYIERMCRELNEYTLLPGRSKYLRIEQGKEQVIAHFGKEKIPFLPRDIKILPVENVTLEDLSHYLLEKFLREFVRKGKYPISFAEVRVFSGPGQSANAAWKGKA